MGFGNGLVRWCWLQSENHHSILGVVSERNTNGSLLIATSGGLNQQTTRMIFTATTLAASGTSELSELGMRSLVLIENWQ
ncbi:hypothetical protein C5167_044351 [Papaver somniferum]|uniref:Uncharacterized protein n=1 Tax=Papaver somniferum TaxID=3469 RepID=A0A4Y7L8C2_PAPSO|nr:hypothetical protein C5167_044351 [Papaver somniferum]